MGYVEVQWHQCDELGPMKKFLVGCVFFWQNMFSPIEIHCWMTEMCGDGVMRVQHVRIWCRGFRNGRMDIRDNSYAYWTMHHLDIWIKVDQLWWHLLYYVNLLLNMFQMLIHPSSGACYYLVCYCIGCIVLTWGVLVLCSGIGCWWFDNLTWWWAQQCSKHVQECNKLTCITKKRICALSWSVAKISKSAGWTTSGAACTQIPHHQQPIPLHNTNTPQVSTIQPTQ